MPTLIEVERSRDLPATMALEVGDILRVGATGARMDQGNSVSYLGAFRSGYLNSNGKVIGHSGFPDSVLFHAVQPGAARITVFAGEPFSSPVPHAVHIDVVAPAPPMR